MSTLSSANVTDVNRVLKEHTHMRLCINMLIFMHNLGNWLINETVSTVRCCSPEDIERFREEMVKHQPQLAVAAQKAAAMMSSNEAGAVPSSSHIGSSRVPPSKVSAAAVNGETVTAKLSPSDCDPEPVVDGPSAEVEDQSCDQDVTKEDC